MVWGEYDVASGVKSLLRFKVVWVYYGIVFAFNALLAYELCVFWIQFGFFVQLDLHLKRGILVNSNGFQDDMRCLCPCLLLVEVHGTLWHEGDFGVFVLCCVQYVLCVPRTYVRFHCYWVVDGEGNVENLSWFVNVMVLKLVVKSVLRYVDALGEVEADVMFLELVKVLERAVVCWYIEALVFSELQCKLNPKALVSRTDRVFVLLVNAVHRLPMRNVSSMLRHPVSSP